MANQFPRCVLTTTSPLSEEAERWLLEHRAEVDGKLAREVAAIIPVDLQVSDKYRVMKRVNIQFNWRKKRGTILEQLPVNWKLPNWILNDIWDRHDNWAGNNRYRLGIANPIYRHKGWTDFPDNWLLPGLLDDIESELAKADKLGIKSRMGDVQPLIERLRQWTATKQENSSESS